MKKENVTVAFKSMSWAGLAVLMIISTMVLSAEELSGKNENIGIKFFIQVFRQIDISSVVTLTLIFIGMSLYFYWSDHV